MVTESDQSVSEIVDLTQMLLDNGNSDSFIGIYREIPTYYSSETISIDLILFSIKVN